MRKLRMILLGILIFIGYSRTTAPAEISDSVKSWRVIEALNFLELERYNKELELFADQLGFDESHNNWLAVNTIGAFGEHQWMESTLRHIGYGNITLQKFKKDPSIFTPEVQKEALKVLIKCNTLTMRKYMNEYVGQTIRGIKISRAGILAACHLGGPRSVQLYLASNGSINKADIYGTSIEKYLRNYQNFNLDLNLI